MPFVYENPFSLSDPGEMTSANSFNNNNNITIDTSPANIVAANNPIVWKFKSSASTQNNIYSQLVFEVLAVPDTGNYLLISADTVGDYPTFQLVCKDIPGAGEIYSNSTSPAKNANDLAECIVAVLNSDYNFKQRFYAVQDANEVTIQARQQGARYNLNFFATDPDLSLLSVTDSGDWNRGQILKDYTIYADVYVGSSGNYADLTSRLPSERVGTVEIDYQPNNIYNFEISSFVQPYVSTSLPIIGANTFQKDNSAVNNVYLVFGERYDEFSNNFRKPFPVGQTGLIWVHNSALDYSISNNLSAYSYSLSTPQLTGKPFLTSQPDVKETFTNEKEFLSCLIDGSSNYQVRIKGYYEYLNGTQVTYNSKFSTAILSGGCYTVDVSYANMSFPTSAPIRRYSAKLMNYNVSLGLETQVSKEQIYDVLPDCPTEYQMNFIWLNSLGGWDSFMFNAEIEDVVERKSDEFITPPSLSPSVEDRLNKDYLVSIEKTRVVNSAWINKQHFDWLIELAKSDDVRYLDSGKWIPVNIQKIDYNADSIEQMYQIQIEYKIAREINLNSNNT